MIPAVKTASPSQSASTSTSIALLRNGQVELGFPRDVHGIGDIALKLRLVVDDLHRAPAKHIGGADNQWVANLTGDALRFLTV